MQKRLFVAANLPEDVKKRLFRFVEKEYGNLPACPAPQLRSHSSSSSGRLLTQAENKNKLWCGVKWTRQENFHLTLNFLGFIAEENIPEICEDIRQIAESFPAFELEFRKTELGPEKDNPKMIWASGEKSGELAELKYRLDKMLGFRAREKKEFRPHITLGRIRRGEWKKIYPRTTKHSNCLSAGRENKFVVRGEPYPDAERDFVFSVPVSSIELFESKFEKGKRIYYALESFPLK